MTALASSFRLPSGLTLKNRIAKAAMSEGMADRDGNAGLALARLYRAWSDGGAALLLTGNIVVDGSHPERSHNVIVESEHGAPGLRALAEAAHAGGAAIFAQLSHAGRQTSRLVNDAPRAPSAVAAVRSLGGFAKPVAMSSAEVLHVKSCFIRAARISREAGFDGVQLHAAHGYLINQFLSPLTNLREDEWGGSLEARARLLVEITRAIRKEATPGFSIAVKLNSADFQRGGFEEDDAVKVAKMLEAEGIDLLEISGGTYEGFAAFGTGKTPSAREAYFLEFAEKLRTASRVPVMLTGGFRTRRGMENALETGAVDVIGLARSCAIEPDFPRRLLSDPNAVAKESPGRIPIRAFAELGETSFYTHQLRRVGDGLPPDPGASVIASTIERLFEDSVYGRRMKASLSRRSSS